MRSEYVLSEEEVQNMLDRLQLLEMALTICVHHNGGRVEFSDKEAFEIFNEHSGQVLNYMNSAGVASFYFAVPDDKQPELFEKPDLRGLNS